MVENALFPLPHEFIDAHGIAEPLLSLFKYAISFIFDSTGFGGGEGRDDEKLWVRLLSRLHISIILIKTKAPIAFNKHIKWIK